MTDLSEKVVLDRESEARLIAHIKTALAQQQPQEGVSVDEAAAMIRDAIDARVDRKIQESRTTQPTETREELMEGAANEILEDPQAGFAELFRGMADRKRRKQQ